MLRINDACVRYGKNEVLHGVSFEVNKGDVVALIGPNGVGKTTLLKIMAGLIPVSRGDVFWNEKSIYKCPASCGVLIEEPKYYPNMTGQDNLKMIQSFDSSLIPDEALIEKLKMVDLLHKKCSSYSLGMRKKLGLIIATMGNPNYLILDEPQNGLDHDGVEVLRWKIMNYKQEGGVIVLASHDISEISRTCNRALFVQNGEIVQETPVTDPESLELVYKGVFND